MQGVTKCAVKATDFVPGDKLCRGDKMCRNIPSIKIQFSLASVSLQHSTWFLILVSIPAGSLGKNFSQEYTFAICTKQDTCLQVPEVKCVFVCLLFFFVCLFFFFFFFWGGGGVQS